MKNGTILTIIVLLPNLIVLIFPPKEEPPKYEESMVLRGMTVIEQIGRAIVFITPLFYSINFNTNYQLFSLYSLIIAIAFYYVGWLRYLLYGRLYKLLFEPMLGVPIPMAISPVIFFLFSSIVLDTWLLFIGTIFLAVGHIYVSYHSYNQIKNV